MRKSLRWRLQVWHALILFLVVAGFGMVCGFQGRRSWFEEIDGDLLAGARVLEGVLRTLPRGPAPGDRPVPSGAGLGALAFDRALSLPPLRRGPGRRDDVFEEAFFVVWGPDGQVVRDDPPGVADTVPPDERVGPGFPHRFRSRGRLREVVLMGPGRTTIVVGRPIDRELGALSRLTWRLVLAGSGVFAAGLIGGWWLSSRAVGPIAEISGTVEGITASSLSRRIDVQDVDFELEALAAMINTMLDRLERSFDQQSQFTADASHELRTPLSVILTQVELALSRPRSEGEYRDALASCGRAARRMKSLVEDLLTLSRADSGHLGLNIEPVDLVAIVDECVEVLGPLAERRGVRLINGCGCEKVELMADPDRLAQVVTNLLENAVLYNREDGAVRVSTEIEGDVAVLTVSDTGVGIADDQCPRVFDRFYRVDRARARETGGSGLGLAIVREIVEAHGGSIQIESVIGQGTTVRARFRDWVSGPKTEGLAQGPFPTPSERGDGRDSAPANPL